VADLERLGKAIGVPFSTRSLRTHYIPGPPTQRLARPTSTFLAFCQYTMAQIRGTAGYHLGNQSPFGNGGRSDSTTNDPSPLDQLREQTNKIEDFLDTLSEPVKP
jgi:hypothetical protein